MVHPGLKKILLIVITMDDSSDETEYVDDNRMKKQTQDNTDNTTYAYSNSSQRRKFAVGLLTGLDFDILRLKFPNNSELSDILPRKKCCGKWSRFQCQYSFGL